MRLFVAAAPPPAVAEALAAWGRSVRRDGMGPVRAANLHLTLAFLGERAAEEAGAIADAVAAAVAGPAGVGSGPPRPTGLRVGAPLWLPPRRPRALAVAVEDPHGALAALHDAVAAELGTAIGWRPDRPLRPHITVARLGGRAAPGPLAPTPPLRFDVEAVVLHRSFLDPEGARYEALERIALS